MNERQWLMLSLLIGLHLTVTALEPAIAFLNDGNSVILQGSAIFYGICLSQLSLIAVWAVFAPTSLVMRLFSAFWLAMAVWLLLVAGSRSVMLFRFGFDLPRRDALQLALLGGAAIVVVQTPLWMFRALFRFRLSLPRPPASERPQFSLRKLLISTAVFCVLLAIAMVVLPPRDATEVPWSKQNWLEGALFLAAVSIAQLAICLPALAIALGVRGWRLLLAMAGLGFWAAVVSTAEFWIAAALFGEQREQVGLGLWLLNLGQGISVIGSLVALRAIGFSWQVRRACLPLTIATTAVSATPVAAASIHPLDKYP